MANRSPHYFKSFGVLIRYLVVTLLVALALSELGVHLSLDLIIFISVIVNMGIDVLVGNDGWFR